MQSQRSEASNYNVRTLKARDDEENDWFVIGLIDKRRLERESGYGGEMIDMWFHYRCERNEQKRLMCKLKCMWMHCCVQIILIFFFNFWKTNVFVQEITECDDGFGYTGNLHCMSDVFFCIVLYCMTYWPEFSNMHFRNSYFLLSRHE